MSISIPYPDDPHGVPTYEGSAEHAFYRLMPGLYATSEPGQTLIVEAESSYLVKTDEIEPRKVTEAAINEATLHLYEAMYGERGAIEDLTEPQVAWLKEYVQHGLEAVVAFQTAIEA
jgi:hypothetical protein